MILPKFKQIHSGHLTVDIPAEPRGQRIDRHRPLGAVMGKPKDLRWPATFSNPALAELVQCDKFSDFLARDNIEIPAPEDREGYNEGLEYMYWLTGFSDYLCMNGSLSNFLSRDLSILDFGGCSGRVARHILSGSPNSHITIAEANVGYVDWVNTYFGENCRGLQVGPSPEIPLPNDVFDFAFGLSVFTHIEFGELGWLKELVRVVKPGGYIYLTILSEHSWSTMDKTMLHKIIKTENKSNDYLASALGGPMPFERFSTTLEFNDVVNNSNTFHSSAYIKRVWGKLATVDKIVFGAHGEQTAVILRNDKKSQSWMYRLERCRDALISRLRSYFSNATARRKAL